MMNAMIKSEDKFNGKRSNQNKRFGAQWRRVIYCLSGGTIFRTDQL